MFKLREVRDSDISFIYATWLRSLYYGNAECGQIERESFFKHYPSVIEHQLAPSDVVVLCLADDEDVIIGFSVIHGDVLHFAYVKRPFRKKGLAKQMLAGTGIRSVTCLTAIGNAIRLKYKWAYNPFLT